MLSIGTKKYRNLQEQVAYNTECIKKLDDYLDGIVIEDKLVAIESDSGTFTDEELVILSAPLAFISDGSKVWMKQNETLTQLVFKAIEVVITEVGSAYFNLGLSQIVINRETGSYNSSADTFFTTYSKTQLDSIIANIMTVKADKTELTSGLALKANIAGQAFTGAITAPSIIEDMSGYTFTPNWNLSTNGFTLNYAGVVKNGNKITFAIAGTAVRNANTSYNVDIGVFDIPTSVLNKLYPNSLGALDCKLVSFFSGTLDNVGIYFRVTKGGSSIGIQSFRVGNDLVIGTTYEFRWEVTFLLSENLAS